MLIPASASSLHGAIRWPGLFSIRSESCGILTSGSYFDGTSVASGRRICGGRIGIEWAFWAW